MAELWLTLLAGSTLVIIGFLAAQLFDRYRVPDYFVLIALGLVLGAGIVPIVGTAALPAFAAIAPVLTNIAFAFILFEGGLALTARLSRGTMVAVVGHTLVAMAISAMGIWFVGTRVLGLNDVTSIILAAAFIGPSAAIVLSVLPSLRVTDRTRALLILEGVLANILAVAVILVFVRFPGTAPDPAGLAVYGAQVAGSALTGAVGGLVWHRAVGGSRSRRFSFMTTVALAVFLYAVADGLLGGTGGVAAFAFGLVLGRKGTLAADARAARGTPGHTGLPEFHRELVFLLRTFFFLYLGLRIQLTNIEWASVGAALAFVAIFFVSRFPSTFALRVAWRLPRLDIRLLRAVVARGMTDTILILYAVDVGVVEPAKASFVVQLLFLVVLFAAAASAVLIIHAERRAAQVSVPAEARGAPTPSGIVQLAAASTEPIADPIDESPPG